MLAAWIFGSVLLVFLMSVMLAIPELSHGQMSLVRFFMALLAGFFAYFFVGEIALRGRIFGHHLAAGGGVALFVLIQLFVDPFAIRAVAGDYIPHAVRPDSRLKHAQGDLRRLQLLQKAPDGIRDSKTTVAIRLFQAQNNLPIDGALSTKTLHALEAAIPPMKSAPPPLPESTPASHQVEDARSQPAPTVTTIERPSVQLTPTTVTEATVSSWQTPVPVESALPAEIKTKELQVEIKCLVAVEKIPEISEKLGLTSRTPLLRTICFFDTDSLALFQHDPKLILRSRCDSAIEADTTVKVRGGKVKGKGAECEFDKVLGKERTESCSIIDQKKTVAEIQVANGGKSVKKIFSKEQEGLAEDTLGKKMNWDKLRPYGPVEGVRVWKKIKAPGCPPLTVERWNLPARSSKPARVLLEISAKVPLAEEARTAKAIADFLGVSEDQSNESETKTRIVLEHFAVHSP